MSQATRIDALLEGVRVMPVVVIEDEAQALPLADALFAGGVRAVEITLRTPAALPAIKAIAAARQEMTVGAGTILSGADLSAAAEAGARFAVSPGLTPALVEAAGRHENCPLLPGTVTASEVMAALDVGFGRLKFFPAEPSGGAQAVGALAGPLPAARFCPTGSITPEKAAGYLNLPNVFCVGGSWLTPKAALSEGRWDEIERLARESAAL